MNWIAQLGLQTVAGLAIVAGIAGCFIPVIPGPILAYAGLLCLIPTANAPSVAALVTFGVLTIVVTILDYIVPAIGAKKFDCSKSGVWGCNIGIFVGIFLAPLGILFGPFIGAVIGELIARKPLSAALKGGLGAFLGFLSGVFIKVVACAMMFVCFTMCL